MPCYKHVVQSLACCVLLAIAQPAAWCADDTPSCRRNPFDRDSAPPLTIASTDWHCPDCKPYQFERAGCPQSVRPHAKISNTNHYDGWLVGGGGQVIGGDGPCRQEGTWGWDYLGLLNRKIVFLDWNHGTREQAGTGAYKTDGPKVQWHK